MQGVENFFEKGHGQWKEELVVRYVGTRIFFNLNCSI